MKKEWSGYIPFDGSSMIPHADDDDICDKASGRLIIWEECCVFTATLTFVGFDKRSPYRTIWYGKDGRMYVMAVSEFSHVIQKVGMQGDKISAAWTFRKRGLNYSICLDDEQPPKWCTTCDAGMYAAVQYRRQDRTFTSIGAKRNLLADEKAVWFCLANACTVAVMDEELPHWYQGSETDESDDWSDTAFGAKNP